MTEVTFAVSCCQTFLCAVRRVKSDGSRGQGSSYRVPCESCFRLRPPDLPTSVLCSLGSVGLRGPADQLDGHDKTEAAEDAHSYIEKHKLQTHTHTPRGNTGQLLQQETSISDSRLLFTSSFFTHQLGSSSGCCLFLCFSSAVGVCTHVCVCVFSLSVP